MPELEVWYAPIAQCWRVEDGIMFTYYDAPSVVNHFVHRDRPGTASLVGKRTVWHPILIQALQRASINFVDFTEDTQAV
ncbi:MAG TPA: hypothetical protein VNM70_09635 [Burkholderiales bacterium]|nr:hypothetical protein [Burkholderiales bacterium]